jgi:MFS family permease
MAVDALVWGIGWGLLYGMITDTLHFSVEQLGIMASVQSLAWAVMQMPIGRYIDRRDSKAVMIFSEVTGIPLMLIWLTQTNFEVFVAGQVLFAITAATWVPTTSTFLTRRVNDAERAEAFGRLSAFRGLISFPGPAIGGLLYSWGGMRAPLMVNLMGIFVVIVILVLFVPGRK